MIASPERGDSPRGGEMPVGQRGPLSTRGTAVRRWRGSFIKIFFSSPAGQSAGMDRPGTAHPHHDAVAGRKNHAGILRKALELQRTESRSRCDRLYLSDSLYRIGHRLARNVLTYGKGQL